MLHANEVPRITDEGTIAALNAGTINVEAGMRAAGEAEWRGCGWGLGGWVKGEGEEAGPGEGPGEEEGAGRAGLREAESHNGADDAGTAGRGGGGCTAAAAPARAGSSAAATTTAAAAPFDHYEAGSYTRSLFSSTRAVSDTQKHPTHPKHPLTPLTKGYTTPTRTPYLTQSAQVELRSERV